LNQKKKGSGDGSSRAEKRKFAREKRPFFTSSFGARLGSRGEGIEEKVSMSSRRKKKRPRGSGEGGGVLLGKG